MEVAAAVLLQLISTGAMPASLLPTACEHLSLAATGSAPTSPADSDAEQVMAICALECIHRTADFLYRCDIGHILGVSC